MKSELLGLDVGYLSVSEGSGLWVDGFVDCGSFFVGGRWGNGAGGVRSLEARFVG